MGENTLTSAESFGVSKAQPVRRAVKGVAQRNTLPENQHMPVSFPFFHLHQRACPLRGLVSGCTLQLNYFLPETKTTKEGVGIAAKPATRWQFL
jgi:hypothetical protein